MRSARAALLVLLAGAGRAERPCVTPDKVPGGQDYICGGREQQVCRRMREYLLAETPEPDLAEVREACGPGSTGADRWTEVYLLISTLHRGHDYTPDERARAERAYAELRRLLGAPGLRDDPRWTGLEERYLGRLRKLDDAENAAALAAVADALERFEAGARSHGALAAATLAEWKAFALRFERFFMTPGSALPEKEALIRRFEAVARRLDVESRLLDSPDSPRERFVSADGSLTAEGAKVADRAADLRRRLRTISLLGYAKELERARDRSAEVEAARRRAEELGRKTLAGMREQRDPEDIPPDVAALKSRYASLQLPPPPAPEQLEKSDIPEFYRAMYPDHASWLYRVAALKRSRPGFDGMLRDAALAYKEHLERRDCARASDLAECRGRAEREAKEAVYGRPGSARGLMLAAYTRSATKEGWTSLWNGVKHFIPGYDCFELYDNWSKSSTGRKTGEAAFCALGFTGLGLAKGAVKTGARLGRKSGARAVPEELQGLPVVDASLLSATAVKPPAHFKSEWASIELRSFEGRTVVLKAHHDPAKLAAEANMYRYLQDKGIVSHFRGVTRLGDGRWALATDYAEGVLVKSGVQGAGIAGMHLYEAGALLKLGIGERTFVEMRRIARELEKAGVHANDLQFVIVAGGRPVLIDPGDFTRGFVRPPTRADVDALMARLGVERELAEKLARDGQASYVAERIIAGIKRDLDDALAAESFRGRAPASRPSGLSRLAHAEREGDARRGAPAPGETGR